MERPVAASPSPTSPLAELGARLFTNLGVDGIHARSALYVRVLDALQAFVTGARPAQAEVMRFPPVMSRAQLEKSGYLKSFPNLLGCVCALHGTEAAIRSAADRQDAGGSWTDALTPADLVLTPAACYPLYPLVAARGGVPAGGLQFDIEADCFRHEPSPNLDRLQSFRMREFVCIGAAADIVDFRERWMARAPELATTLGLPFTVEVANDPFFGRVGQVMAVSQRQQALKFELLVPFHPSVAPTACMSFNYHRDHFGQTWGLRTAAGELAHTGCVAFGMDRLTVALFAIHGTDLGRWPGPVRAALGL